MSSATAGRPSIGSAPADEAADQPSAATTVKGPPLGSSSHTVRLLVLLTMNSVLILLCLFVLPAHLLWRQAVKQNDIFTRVATEAAKAAAASKPVSQAARDAVRASSQRADSATRNLTVAFRLLFTTANSDVATVAWIQRGLRSTIAPVVLSQAWFMARLKGWWDEAEAMERGDRDEVMKRRRIGIGKQMENVTLTTFALPLVAMVLFVVVIVCGAPVVARPLDTLVLAGYLSVLAVFPAANLLGTDEREWVKAFSWSPAVRQACVGTPRFRVLVRMALATFAGALIGSAGVLLDWEKAWQTYPMPTVLGACLGQVVGNAWAAVSYYFAAPSRSAGGARVERKAPSSSAKSKAAKKKKKR